LAVRGITGLKLRVSRRRIFEKGTEESHFGEKKGLPKGGDRSREEWPTPTLPVTLLEGTPKQSLWGDRLEEKLKKGEGGGERNRGAEIKRLEEGLRSRGQNLELGLEGKWRSYGKQY